MGKHVVQALVEAVSKGEDVKVVVGTRAPQALSCSSVLESVQCDMSSPASLQAAIAGAKCQRVFLCLPQCLAPRDMVAASKVVVDAAVEAGVDLLVRVGSLGQADQGPLGEAHEACEEYCRERALPVTSIRPTSFHVNFEKYDVDSIKNENCFRSPLGPSARVNWVHCGDVGRVAAALMLQEQVEQVVEVTGPAESCLSTGEMAALLTQELGRSVRYEEVEAPGLQEYEQLWSFLKKGGFDSCSGAQTVARMTGQQPVGFHHVVRQLMETGSL